MGVKKRTGGPTNGRRDKAFLGVECIAVLLPIEQSNVERRWILTFVLSVPTALPTLSWLCLKLIHPILNCRPIWENPRRGNSPCLQLSLKKKKKAMRKKMFFFYGQAFVNRKGWQSELCAYIQKAGDPDFWWSPPIFFGFSAKFLAQHWILLSLYRVHR